MHVCGYDLHYNVLWGQYISELKGLMNSWEERFLCKIAVLHLYNQLLLCNACVVNNNSIYGTWNPGTTQHTISNHYGIQYTVYIGIAMGGPAL